MARDLLAMKLCLYPGLTRSFLRLVLKEKVHNIEEESASKIVGSRGGENIPQDETKA